MDRDIYLNKAAVIERCLKRIAEEYAGDKASLRFYAKQDSIILNLLRACEASIDLAMHVVAERQLGIPQSSRDAFEILRANCIISEGLAQALKAMVGFRNVAVHDYQAINLEIIQAIVEKNLGDFKAYLRELAQYTE